jgi:glutamate-1-semialdehyde 2,1-aminomutase
MNSEKIFEKACEILPGGVNSPVRAYRAVGMTPPFIDHAKGSRIYDIDGHAYVDYVGSWGPMILGHAREEVVEAVTQAAIRGTSYGAPTTAEVALAQMIRDAVPSMEMMRMVNSGTEAVMSAIRAARGYTGRELVVKFEGCYHGHSDGLLVKAGSGLLTENTPDSAGIPAAFAATTLIAQYNDLESVKHIFSQYGDNIAALIVEPVAANMGVVAPEPGFLEGLREVTSRYGAVLIFDEVITGFRMSYGGAQAYYHVTPDMTTFGKIVGGGMPMAVYGGRKEIMQCVSPVGPVYQAGTLSGNPVAVAAGMATLKLLREDQGIYDRIEERSARIQKAFETAISRYQVQAVVNRAGSLMSIFFTHRPVRCFADVMTSNLEQFRDYFGVMKANGMYIAPSQFEAIFINDALTEEDLQMTEAAIDKALSLWKG